MRMILISRGRRKISSSYYYFGAERAISSSYYYFGAARLIENDSQLAQMRMILILGWLEMRMSLMHPLRQSELTFS